MPGKKATQAAAGEGWMCRKGGAKAARKQCESRWRWSRGGDRRTAETRFALTALHYFDRRVSVNFRDRPETHEYARRRTSGRRSIKVSRSRGVGRASRHD
jgi:hypothetical protein